MSTLTIVEFVTTIRRYAQQQDLPITLPDDTIPASNPGTALDILSAKIVTQQTTPPGRYTEASLIKTMKARAIGRPSTYASIIETLLFRQYIERKKHQFVPTSLGVLVYQVLDDQFDFMSIDFTASMEATIDDIAQGQAEYQPRGNTSGTQRHKAGDPCPECDSGTLKKKCIQNGKHTGKHFLGCTQFPTCRCFQWCQ